MIAHGRSFALQQAAGNRIEDAYFRASYFARLQQTVNDLATAQLRSGVSEQALLSDIDGHRGALIGPIELPSNSHWRATVQGTLDASSAALALAEVDGNMLGWVITQASIDSYALGDSAAWHKAFDDYARWLRNPLRGNDSPPALASRLEPMFAAVAGFENLVVAIGEQLPDVAFAALQRADGRFLLDHHAVVQTQSLYRWAQRANMMKQPTHSLSIVSPSFDQKRGLSPLTAARSDDQLLASATAMTRLVGANATLSAIGANRWSSVGIIHIASHALVDSQFPARSRIALAGEVDLTFDAIRNLPLDDTSPLVVLAACEGAQGKILPGSGPMSLAAAFVTAGASSVIAATDAIGDRAASQISQTFYRWYFANKRSDRFAAASALAQSQREFRRRNTQNLAWASLITTG